MTHVFTHVYILTLYFFEKYLMNFHENFCFFTSFACHHTFPFGFSNGFSSIYWYHQIFEYPSKSVNFLFQWVNSVLLSMNIISWNWVRYQNLVNAIELLFNSVQSESPLKLFQWKFVKIACKWYSFINADIWHSYFFNIFCVISDFLLNLLLWIILHQKYSRELVKFFIYSIQIQVEELFFKQQ